jgi:hypothetical protein
MSTSRIPRTPSLVFPFGIGEIISEDVPDVTIEDISVIEGNSGYKSVYFTLVLSDVHSENVTVSYSTVDGTAKAGSDYQGLSGAITIPSGASAERFGLTSRRQHRLKKMRVSSWPSTPPNKLI